MCAEEAKKIVEEEMEMKRDEESALSEIKKGILAREKTAGAGSIDNGTNGFVNGGDDDADAEEEEEEEDGDEIVDGEEAPSDLDDDGDVDMS